jgi:hypothetical protein
MTDPDEVQLGKLAKRMLDMPPKRREDSKLGKANVKPEAQDAPPPKPRSELKKVARQKKPTEPQS